MLLASTRSRNELSSAVTSSANAGGNGASTRASGGCHRWRTWRRRVPPGATPPLGAPTRDDITGDYFLAEELVSQIEALDARLYLKPVWEEDLLKIVQAKDGQPKRQDELPSLPAR
jgi:hypothetical protein